MELIEAIFEMFGKAIVFNYLKFIEDSFPLKERRDERIKKIQSAICTCFAIIFVLSFFSLMMIIGFEGVLRTIGIVVVAVCFSIVVIYVVLGYILKSIAERKNSN